MHGRLLSRRQRARCQARVANRLVKGVVGGHKAGVVGGQQGRLTAWVLGISRHKLMDLYRRRGRREALHEPIDGWEEHLAAEEPGETLANVDLRSLLEKLPKAQRVAIEMTKLEGLSVAQASARSGSSESAIKVQVHRGLTRLAALVRKEST